MKKLTTQMQGNISAWRYRDAISGNEIEVTVSQLYRTLRINNRCYYFRVEDGTFDGTSTDKTIKTFSGRSPTDEQHLQSS